ncbi:Pre-toxin TG [Planifilum fulgidum]|uniref:Pre-toxin TG n=1 Tax=Planifilum fulgidum TaxID=201973 RepID=A0A1I2QZU8_9BACL|nr:pre-toxin TG domain-containing protein [Planifilum fulgidum]SFG33570.1 Pre-toxin TG [Planifilum fulgidum]
MEGLGFYLLGKLRQWCVLAIAHLPFSLLRKGRFGYEFVAEAIEGDGRIQPAHRRGSQTVEYVVVLAAGALLAGLLYAFIAEDDGVKNALREKIEQILAFEETPSGTMPKETGSNQPDSFNARDRKGEEDGGGSWFKRAWTGSVDPTEGSPSHLSKDRSNPLAAVMQAFGNSLDRVMHPKTPFDYFRSLTFQRTLFGGGEVDRFLSALIIANDFGIEAANQTDPNETVTLFGQEVKQRTVFDIVLDFNPIKGLQEALDGRNYVTNEKLGPFSRAVSGVTSLLSFVPGEGQAVGQVMKQGIKQAGKYTLEPAVKGGFKQADRWLKGKLVKITKVDSHKVVNDLSDFKSRKMTFGNQTFMIDKKGMKHILQRHHPKYWDGSVKSKQTFLDKDMTIDEITIIIQEIMKQNRDTLIKKGNKGSYQIEGTVNGVQYVVGLNRGRVGQFYKK